MSTLDLATAEQVATFCGCGARSFETMEKRLQAAGIAYISRRKMAGISLHPAVDIALLKAPVSRLHGDPKPSQVPTFLMTA
jgi:hypothetical protein